MPRVISIPIVGGDSTLCGHTSMEPRAWIRRENVKRRCLDAMRDRPLHGSFEHRSIVGIHAEHKASVDHHAEIVQTLDRAGIVSPKVLILPLLDQIRRIQRFEADEQASKTALDSSLEQTGHEDGIDGAGSLPQASHSAHPVEQARGKPAIAEEMVVQEVEMATWQPLDLGQRIIDGLGIK